VRFRVVAVGVWCRLHIYMFDVWCALLISSKVADVPSKGEWDAGTPARDDFLASKWNTPGPAARGGA